MGALLCLAVALAAAPSEPIRPIADPSFVEGVALYQKLEYEQAVLRFETVAVRTDLSSTERAQALVWLGLSYAGIGNFDAAKTQFQAAFRLDRTAKLPTEVSPRIVELFEQTRASLPPEAPPDDKGKGDGKGDGKDGKDGKADPPGDGKGKAPTDARLSWPFLAGAGGVAVGVTAAVAGALLAVDANNKIAEANDPEFKDRFQDEAKALEDTINLELTGAFVLLPLGAALVIGGGVLAFMPLDGAAAPPPE